TRLALRVDADGGDDVPGPLVRVADLDVAIPQIADLFPLWVWRADVKPLVLAGQVAVAVAVHVQRLAVLNDPDSRPSLRPKHQQAVPRLDLVDRLFANRPVDLAQVSGRRWNRRHHPHPEAHHPGAESEHDYVPLSVYWRFPEKIAPGTRLR